MAQITWAENYGVIRERLRGIESEVLHMNRNGGASKNTLHSFASRLYEFNKATVPQLVDRCRELEVRLDEAIALVARNDRAITTMIATQERSADKRGNDTEETLEKARLELELEKARLEIERLRLQVQRLEERGDGKGVATTEE